MIEIIRRFKLMNRKYFIGITIGLIVMSVVSRLLLSSNNMYFVSCFFLGICGVGLYYSLVKK